MPNPYSLTSSPWPVSLIIITTLSVVIVCTLVSYRIYSITARKRPFFKNPSPQIQDGHFGEVTPDNLLENCQVQMEPDSIHFGADTARRLPLSTMNETSVQFAHSSVHNESSPGSNPESNQSKQTQGTMNSEAGNIIPTTIRDFKKLPEESQGNDDLEKSTRISSHPLNCKIHQNVSSEAPVIIQLRSDIPDEQLEKSEIIHSDFNGRTSGLGSLLEMSHGEIDASISSAGSPGGFDQTTTSKRPLQSLEKFLEHRVVPTEIVETTEKKKPSQVLRKKLLSLVSIPSNQRLGNLLKDGDQEATYYWEMMQVESNDTWWQLPFPPQFSPIEANFQLPQSES